MNRDLEHLPREHSNTISSLPFRDEKQETVVVRPYPQVQAHAQPLATAQHHMQQPGVPVTMGAPPTHLAQATQLTFPEGLMKVCMLRFINISWSSSFRFLIMVQEEWPGTLTM